MLKTYVKKKNQIVQNSKFHTPTWLVFFFFLREMTYVATWIIDKKNKSNNPNLNISGFH
jgi:hypothetical protein